MFEIFFNFMVEHGPKFMVGLMLFGYLIWLATLIFILILYKGK